MDNLLTRVFGSKRGRYGLPVVLGLLLIGAAALVILARRDGEGEFRTDPGTDVFVFEHTDSAAGAPLKSEAAIRGALKDLERSPPPAGKITVDYPRGGSLFPPDMVAPTFLWHDPDDTVKAWLVDVSFQGHPRHVYAVTSGKRTRRQIDPQCITEDNAWTESAYQSSARGWTPDEPTWWIIKQRSMEKPATVSIYGLTGAHGSEGAPGIVSCGTVSLATSNDPVGAPIFYRDVPLMPSKTKDKIIKPLAPSSLPLIQWRLRDLTKPIAPVVMAHMPTCANCHSFSADGETLAMDVDGPDGDKGAHTLMPVGKRMVMQSEHVFTWNSFTKGTPGAKPSFGLFPQISPDGDHVVATVHESVFVQNYMDYRFLQTFYPTGGILAVYSRATGRIRSLPGADEAGYVQSNPTWSPDGKTIVFIRARARPNYTEGPRARYANDPNETQIKYDLYRIPFNDGRGGTPQPVEGASANGASNSFPRYSPDGKWIVYVQCNNGLLMRPDSKLYIIPAGGGKARLMNCNTRRMNSWHSWSPNGRWLVFSSKANTPYTQMFLTHVDEEGNDSPAILIPNSTAANRAVNLPEFADIAAGAIEEITTPAADYRRHYDRARRLRDSGRLTESLAELRKSIDLKSDYPRTYVALANVLVEQNKPLEAIGNYRKAIDISPGNFKAHNNLGVALMKLGRHDDAIGHYRRAVAIHPAYFQAHKNLATLLDHRGKHDEAIKHWRKAVEINPASPAAHNNWGNALISLGKPREAIGHFNEALKIDPTYAQAHLDWGLALMGLAETDEAVKHFSKAVQIAPSRHSAHINRGIALAQLGRAAEAAESYRKAMAADPEETAAHNNLAWLLATHPRADLRDGKEAVRLAEAACKRTRDGDPGVLDTLAAAYAEAGRFDDAVRTAEKALAIARAKDLREFAGKLQARVEQFKKRQPVRGKE